MTVNTKQVLTVILGGGAGTRLFPLTKDRAKPAVPLAGKYRLVDIPISNCINSELRRIYVLTQFQSASMHRHISQSYNFDPFTGGFVEILAAQQTYSDASWWEGTADAVRKNMVHFLPHGPEYFIVLSGDQLYRMDFRQILQEHVESGAEITLATIPVQRDVAKSLGILQIDSQKRVHRFVEKPKDEAALDSLLLSRDWYGRLGIADSQDLLLGSMGIYVFNRAVLMDLLNNNWTDFGKHIIPNAIGTRKVYAHVFQGYWEDIGTIRAFFEAHLDLTVELPRFSFFDMSAPIFTRPRWLPGSKINGGTIDHAMLCDGCIINGAHIEHSVIGIRSSIGSGSRLSRTVMMGCDDYESLGQAASSEVGSAPRRGIGRNVLIENAIIDKNARIGNDVVITPRGKPASVDHPLYYIRDGIVIIPKNAIIPDGTVI
jgi:glucose-1-phosphate adenylyltransferase